MKKSSYVLLMGIVALTACKKQEGPQGPQGPAGPALSGSLVGYVDVYDSYGTLKKLDSVTVSVSGKPYSALTDTNGRFILNNLTTGTYELNFSKPSYQSTKIASINFVGGGTQYINNRIALTQVPSFTINTLNFSIAFGSVTYTINVATADTKPRKAIIFLSKKSNVSSSPSDYMGITIANIASGFTNAIGNITSNTLSQMGVNTGDVVYGIAYPISNANNASVYYDTNTGRLFYNNINTSGASSVSSFTAP